MNRQTTNSIKECFTKAISEIISQTGYLFHLIREFKILGKKTKLLIVLGTFGTVFFLVCFFALFTKAPHKGGVISPVSNLNDVEVAITKLVDGGRSSPFQRVVGRVLGFKELKAGPKRLQYEVFGYLPYWSFDKLQYLHLDLLSTIAYFALEIDHQTGDFLKNGAYWNTWNGRDMKELIERAKTEKTNVVLTIKLFENTPIENFLSCGRCRQNAIDKTLKEIKEKGATGVNVDFEYFGTPPTETVVRYSQFMRDLTDVIHKEVRGATISMAVYATSAREERLHNVELVGNFIDYVFIMGYDFFRPGSTNAGPVAPLTGVGKYGFDMETSVEDFLSKMPAEKIVMGVPYYGYDWPVEGQGVNAKVLPYNDQNGGLSVVYYDQAAIQEKNKSVLIDWDEIAQVPYYSYYSSRDRVWREAYYENERSLREKYDFIKSKKIRGVGIWALGFDGNRSELWDLLEEKFTRL
jgi:spore germination protein YaaH